LLWYACESRVCLHRDAPAPTHGLQGFRLIESKRESSLHGLLHNRAPLTRPFKCYNTHTIEKEGFFLKRKQQYTKNKGRPSKDKREGPIHHASRTEVGLRVDSRVGRAVRLPDPPLPPPVAAPRALAGARAPSTALLPGAPALASLAIQGWADTSSMLSRMWGRGSSMRTNRSRSRGDRATVTSARPHRVRRLRPRAVTPSRHSLPLPARPAHRGTRGSTPRSTEGWGLTLRAALRENRANRDVGAVDGAERGDAKAAVAAGDDVEVGVQHVEDTTGTAGEPEEEWVRMLLATSRRSHASHHASYTGSEERAQPQG
jgi:hypothetical protein